MVQEGEIGEGEKSMPPAKVPLKKVEFVQSKTRLEGTFKEIDPSSVVRTDIITEKPVYGQNTARADLEESTEKQNGDGKNSDEKSDAGPLDGGNGNRRRRGDGKKRRCRGGRKRTGRRGTGRGNYESEDSGPEVGLNGPPEKVQRIFGFNNFQNSILDSAGGNGRTECGVNGQISSKFDRKTYQPERSETQNGDSASIRSASPLSDESACGAGGLGSGSLDNNKGSSKKRRQRRPKSGRGNTRTERRSECDRTSSRERPRIPRQFANVSERFIERALNLILEFVEDNHMKELHFENSLSHDEQNIIFNFFNTNPSHIIRYLSTESRQVYKQILQMGTDNEPKNSLQTVWLKRRKSNKKLLTLVKTSNLVLSSEAIRVSTLRSDTKNLKRDDDMTSNDSDNNSDFSSESDSSARASNSESARKKLKVSDENLGNVDNEVYKVIDDIGMEDDDSSLTSPSALLSLEALKGETSNNPDEKNVTREEITKTNDAPRIPQVGNLKEALKEGLSKKVESSVASRMMELMGWKGGALGPNGEGITEPLQPNLDQSNRKGLGHTVSIAKGRQRRERSDRRRRKRGRRKAALQPPGPSRNTFRLNVLRLMYEFIRDDKQTEMAFELGLNGEESKFIENLTENINEERKFKPSCSDEMHLFDDIMAWKEPSGYRLVKIGLNMQLVVLKETSNMLMLLTPAELCKNYHMSRDLYASENVRKNLLYYLAEFIDDTGKVELRIGGGFTPEEKLSLGALMADIKRGYEWRHRDDSEYCRRIFNSKRKELNIEKYPSKDPMWLWMVTKRANVSDRNVMSISARDI